MKIFTIGFNKCGTTSLHKLYKASGLHSAHWRVSPDAYLAQIMVCNWMGHRPLLTGLEAFDAYSDLFYLSGSNYLEANRLFDVLDRQYPDALFILNTRNKTAWLQSRARHRGTTHPGTTHPGTESGSMLERKASCFGVPEEEVMSIWADQWDAHHAQVRLHFRGQQHRFVEFDIETDPIGKLAAFLDRRCKIQTSAWAQHNPTG